MTREDIIKLVEQRRQIEPPPLLDALKEGELYWVLGSRDVLWIVEQAVTAEREACLAAVYGYPIATRAGLHIKQGIAYAIRERGET